MTPISKPALSVGTIVALVLLSCIAISIAYYYRAQHGFRDLGYFVGFVIIAWWAVHQDWFSSRKDK